MWVDLHNVHLRYSYDKMIELISGDTTSADVER